MKKIHRVIFLLFCLLYFVSSFQDIPLLEVIVKPVPVVMLALFTKPLTGYNKSILAGLVFSLLGDIFLARYFNFFIPGLVLFLIAHLFYIRGFYLKSGKPGIKESLPFLAYGIFIFLFLQPYLGEMLVPVAIYILVIVSMVWRSFVQRKISPGAAYAFYGAVLFCISDTLLAVNLFYGRFMFAGVAVMVTYWCAQFLIYKSIDR